MPLNRPPCALVFAALSHFFGTIASLLICLALLACAGCGKGQAAAAPPPPTVTIGHPIEREVIDWDEYTGYLASPESVDVRPRVSGEIVEAPFAEGKKVNKGDLLFRIDVRPYQADLDAKLAAVDQAKAQVALAEVEYRRNEQAVKQNAVSQSAYDTAKANYDQAKAQQAAAQAAVEASRLNVEWCTVIAPITGRVSNRFVTPGNLVTGGTAAGTLLTTIQSLDPMYCYIDADERSVLRYKQLSAEKKRVSARDAEIPCFIQLVNETHFPHEGIVDFVDNRIDPNTGTLRARGVFANPNNYLEPGFFARMRIPGSGRYRAVLVPDAAIGTQQNIKYLLVLNADDTVRFQPVTLGTVFGTLRSIVQGISPDDRVIINGIMSARPGTKVIAQEKPISMEGFEMTAPGSPTTQALPTTEPSPEDQPPIDEPRPPATSTTGGGGSEGSTR
jgi:RND family efflux transporter MFP subunit